MSVWIANLSASTSITMGWMGILAAFVSGMLLGLLTLSEAALGPYSSHRRRYVRLGHIAMAALGMINILAGLCIQVGVAFPQLSQALLIVGLFTMPPACFATAYHRRFFLLFPIPALSLTAALIVFGIQHLPSHS